MKIRRFLLGCLACLAAAGCKTNPVMTLMEQEHTALEDRIFEQQHQLERARRSLESCRRENASLRRRLEALSHDEDVGPSLGPPSRPSGTLEPPRVELPEEALAPGAVPERIRTPEPIDGPDVSEPPRRFGPLEVEPPAFLQNGGSAESDGWAPHRQVESITLNRLLTGGLDDDRGQPGDEGIAVVIEPRDADRKILKAAAPVAIVVLDPALSGQAARVARWDFSAEEIAGAYRKSALGRGIHLEMLWSAAPPEHTRLHLYVRFATDDGRNLESDKEILVDVPGQPTSGGPSLTPGPRTARTDDEPPRWQQKPPSDEEPSAAQEPREPLHTASRPERPTSEQSGRQPDPPSGRLQRPTWSPDREWQ